MVVWITYIALSNDNMVATSFSAVIGQNYLYEIYSSIFLKSEIPSLILQTASLRLHRQVLRIFRYRPVDCCSCFYQTLLRSRSANIASILGELLVRP